MSDNKTIVAIYPGRFQPMGQHHAQTYNWLENQFGKGNTYIATSDKVTLPKSPFNFQDKDKIFKKMYGINSAVQTKQPYIPKEILQNYDPETTAVLFMVGAKDMAEDPRFRIGLKKNGDPTYFQEYEKHKGNLQGFDKHGYLIVAPHVSMDVPGYGEMSGTQIRTALADPNIDEEQRKELFAGIFGGFDQEIYDLVIGKLSNLSEIMNRFLEGFDIKNVLNETASTTAGEGKQIVDDGPRYFYGNKKTYEAKTKRLAERLGMEVINYIMGEDVVGEFPIHNTSFPKGPVETVSYFPVGVPGESDAGTNYLKDLYGKPGYSKWVGRIKEIATVAGMKFLDFLGAEQSIQSTKNEPRKPEDIVQESVLTSEYWDTWWKTITENPDILNTDAPKLWSPDGVDVQATAADPNAIAFGMHDGKMYSSRTAQYLAHLQKNDPKEYQKIVGDGPKKLGTDHESLIKGLKRGDYTLHGRIWPSKKVIAFWDTPKASEMNKFLDLINKSLKETGRTSKQIDKSWNMVFKLAKDLRPKFDDKRWALMPIESYISGDLKTGALSKAEKEIEHNKSPMQKKQRTVEPGFGSRKQRSHYSWQVPALEEILNETGRSGFKQGIVKSLYAKTNPMEERYKLIYQDCEVITAEPLKTSASVKKAINYYKRLPAGESIRVRDENGKSQYLTFDPSEEIEVIDLKELSEMIKIPIKVGDTILGGRFKNKKIVVRDISKNEKGDITINGRPLLKYRLMPQDKDSINEVYQVELFEELLTEGGAYGHMSHPFDDNDLTFGDFKALIRNALEGKLDFEATTEKTDGQNLMVTWKDGQLKAARNKSTIKNPMTFEELATKFGEHDKHVRDTFVFAMRDLQNAIAQLPEEQRQHIFDNGNNFMNLEIIWPTGKNVIDYDKSVLQFHGALKYDIEKGVPIGEVEDSANLLTQMIKDVNADVQETFSIIPPKVLRIAQDKDFEAKQEMFLDKLAKLQAEYNLSDNDNVGMYHQAKWVDFINDKAKEFGYQVTPDVLEALVKRWGFFDKSFMKLNEIKKRITNPGFLEWALAFDKKDFKAQWKQNIAPFEMLFLQLGTEVLSNVEEFLSANPSGAVKDIRNQVIQTIKDVQATKDITLLQKMKPQLEKIQALGGFDKIVPSEGLVFKYNGKTYKLTGIFAPVNQILGLLKYSR